MHEWWAWGLDDQRWLLLGLQCCAPPPPLTTCHLSSPSTAAPHPQILCDPAKLVLTKTPGACTHKYKSGSTWVGHECKISGGAGFSKEETIGGGNRTIPLIDIDIGYEA